MNAITFKRQRGNVWCLWTEDDHSQVIGTPDILQIPYNITLYITCRKLSTNYTTVVVRGTSKPIQRSQLVAPPSRKRRPVLLVYS